MSTIKPSTAMEGAKYNRANGKDRENTWWLKPVGETADDWVSQLKRNYERGSSLAIDTYWLQYRKANPDSTLLIFHSQGVDPMSGEPYLLTRKVLMDDSVELTFLENIPKLPKPAMGAGMRRNFQPVNVKVQTNKARKPSPVDVSYASEDVVNPFGKLTDDLITEKVKKV